MFIVVEPFVFFLLPAPALICFILSLALFIGRGAAYQLSVYY
jgi:hypothetical protein